MGYIFKTNKFQIQEIKDFQTISIGDIQITAFSANHCDFYFGYYMKSNNKSVVYNPDFGKLQTEVEFIDIDYLVCDGGAFLGYSFHGDIKDFKKKCVKK